MERYSRSIGTLSGPEIEKLHAARVAVVGCGGLGGMSWKCWAVWELGI